MKNTESLVTLTTLANVNEAARVIAQAVVGNDVANTLNGTQLSRQMLYDLIQGRLAAKLAVYTRS